VTPVQSTPSFINEEELRELREKVVTLTSQCAQLDEANRAWQLYQQTQFNNFRNTIHHCLPFDECSSLDQAAQQIIDRIIKERQDFTERYHALENVNDDLRSGNSHFNYSLHYLSIISFR
jgi:exonuclease VII small subunit